MTREEAIEYLDGMKIVIPICNELKELTDERNTAIDMAIEALSVANLKEEFESAEYEDYEHATLVDIKEPLKVLVVRCKDCRYRNGKVNRKGFEVCDATGMDITDNDFCSWGERRMKGGAE